MGNGEPATFIGRLIKTGTAEGEALVSAEPIGFLGGVDGSTGVVTERGHPLEGLCVAGKILVFPTGKGSTVGSYVLYQLATAGLAPAAIISAERAHRRRRRNHQRHSNGGQSADRGDPDRRPRSR